MMKVFAVISASLVIAVVSLSNAPGASARDLMVVGFGGGFQDNARRDLFQAFAKDTGLPVQDDVYNGEQAKVDAMVKANDVTWDVVMVEAPELQRGCEDGIYARMDWSVVKKDKFGPGGVSACGAGAVGWGVALFYDETKVKDGPTTYPELWDLKKYPGKRSLRSGAKMSLEVALLADGVPKDEVYKVLATKEGQDRAFKKLDEIKPQIVWWKSGAQPLQFVGSGEVTYAVGYVGRTAAAAAKDGAHYPLLWKTLLYSYDEWAVVKGSPNQAEAMKFVDYVTDPKPLTALAQNWAVSPATTAVADDPAVKAKNPAMVANHSDDGLFIDTEFWTEHGDDLEKRFAIWAAQ
jgi:putative spermidine/putrescine transport system substrate-binding protein